MKLVSRYLLGDTLRLTFAAFLVFTAIFFVASSVTATRIGIDLAQFVRVSPFIALYGVRYTLPVALLVGAALCLGRLCTDRELLALRACGVHAAAIALPLLAAGLLFCAGLYVFNDRLLPACDYNRRNIVKSFALELLTLQKGANRAFRLPGYTVFCREYEGNALRGLMIFRDDPGLPFEIMAREGQVWLSPDRQHIVIALRDVKVTYYAPAQRLSYGELLCENHSIFIPLPQLEKDRPSFLPLGKLLENSRQVERNIRSLAASLESCRDAGERERASRELGKAVVSKRRLDMEYHERLADSFSPFFFLLVGVPLPLLIESRARLAGAFAALMTVIGSEFALRLAGESLAKGGSLEPWQAMWLGHVATAGVGALLFARLLRR